MFFFSGGWVCEQSERGLLWAVVGGGGGPGAPPWQVVAGGRRQKQNTRLQHTAQTDHINFIFCTVP